MNKFDGQLKGQVLKRMAIDNPWWISGAIAEDYKALPAVCQQRIFPLPRRALWGIILP